MSDFKVERNRDAWATIRGYVYQLNITIKRWIEINDNVVLELECGEDIDHVSNLLASDDTSLARMLEQVKHLEQNLTIRSPESRYAFVCLFEHTETNPEQQIVLRLVTNASIGKEQLCPFRSEQPGITLWGKHNAGGLSPEQRKHFLEGLRYIFRPDDKPDRIPEEVWKRFQCHISDDGRLSKLVARFEWSTGEESADLIEASIKHDLVSKNLITDASQADQMYYRLFSFIAKLLTQRTKKRIRRQDLLTIAHQQANAAEERERRFLASIMSMIEFSKSQLQKQTEDHTKSLIEPLTATIESLASRQTTMQTLLHQYNVTENRLALTLAGDLELPLLPPLVVRRAVACNALLENLKRDHWVILIGGAETGKTILGVLCARMLENGTIWIRMANIDQHKALETLHAAMSTASGIPLQAQRGRWYLDVMRNIGVGRLIVVDELPRITHKTALAEELCLLASACKQTGSYLLTISPYPVLPEAISTDAVNGKLIEVPKFSSDDIRELIKEHSGPDEWLDPSRIGFISGLADEHPSLLNVLVTYLAAHSWQVSEQTYQELIQRKPINQKTDLLLLSLQERFPDEYDRNFIYRLSLFTTSFQFEDLRQVSLVSPELGEPRLRLQKVLGPWAQRLLDDEYRLSPLLRDLGNTELPPATKVRVHVTIGERLMRRQPIDQFKLVAIIAHFCQGEQLNRAMALLVWGLSHVENEEAAKQSDMLLMLWVDKLPSNVDLSLRILTRVYQIKVLTILHRVYDKAMADLLLLLSELDEYSAWAGITAIALLGEKIAKTVGFKAYCGIHKQARFLLTNSQSLPNEFKTSSVSLVWHQISFIKDAQDLSSWLELLRSLSDGERKEFVEKRDIYESSAVALADRFWLREVEKDPLEQKLDRSFEILETLAVESKKLGLTVLWASALRAQIILKGEFQKDVNCAEQLAERALQDLAINPHGSAQFLILESIGRQLSYAKDQNKARPRLISAAKIDVPAFPILKIHLLLEAAESLSDDADSSIQMASEAIVVYKSAQYVPSSRSVIAQCGLAVAYAQQKNYKQSYLLLAEAAKLLFRKESKSKAWRELVIRLGTVIGYYAHVAEHGQPIVLPSGNAPVKPGIAYASHALPGYPLASQYKEYTICLLCTQLSKFAEAVGDFQSASDWAMKALDLARKGHFHLPLSTAGSFMVIQTILALRLEDAVGLAFSVGKSMAYMRRLNDAGAPSDTLAAGAVFSPNQEESIFAESMTIQGCVVPIFLLIANKLVEDQPTARKLGQDFAAICSIVEPTAHFASVWHYLAELLKLTLFSKTAYRDINEFIRSNLEKHNGNINKDAMHISGYIMISINEDLGLHDAFKVHKIILEFFKRTNALKVKERFLVPFLESFWFAALRNSRFAFVAPALVEEKFTALASVEGEERLRRFIAAVSLGLGVPVTA